VKIAYFEAFAGASGNMILGAILDAGLELERLQEGLKTLPITGYTISSTKVKKRGIAGTFVDVKVEGPQEERKLPDIERIILESALPERVKTLSLKVFRRLAEAEAKVHNMPVEEVHFHEVGAVDAIVDVVGSILGLELLGVEEVYVSPLHLGYGMVKSAHGLLPVPAPATIELIKGVPVYGWDVEAELLTPTGAAILTTLACSFGNPPPFKLEKVGYGAGFWDLPFPNLLRLCIGEKEEPGYAATIELIKGVPVYGWDVEAELLTPTGAAILTTLACSFGSPPPFKLEKVGYGAGFWDLPFPNLLRLCIGEKEAPGYEEDYVTVLEANIDDMNPQWFDHLIERLLEAGALDAYLSPIQMKKGRPGVKLGVIVQEEKLEPVLDAIFRESTTIGVRAYRVKRWKLEREEIPVLTPFGEVRVKVAHRGGQILNIAPEYEDCRKLAKERGVALKEIYQAALEEAWKRVRDGPDGAI